MCEQEEKREFDDCSGVKSRKTVSFLIAYKMIFPKVISKPLWFVVAKESISFKDTLSSDASFTMAQFPNFQGRIGNRMNNSVESPFPKLLNLFSRVKNRGHFFLIYFLLRWRAYQLQKCTLSRPPKKPNKSALKDVSSKSLKTFVLLLTWRQACWKLPRLAECQERPHQVLLWSLEAEGWVDA